jgi:hypothetical protein
MVIIIIGVCMLTLRGGGTDPKDLPAKRSA